MISLASEFVFFFLENPKHIVGHCVIVVDLRLVEICGELGSHRRHHSFVPFGLLEVVFVGFLVVLQVAGIRDIVVELLRQDKAGLDVSGLHPELVPGVHGLAWSLTASRLCQSLGSIMILRTSLFEDLLELHCGVVFLMLVLWACGVVGNSVLRHVLIWRLGKGRLDVGVLNRWLVVEELILICGFEGGGVLIVLHRFFIFCFLLVRPCVHSIAKLLVFLCP